MKQKRNAKLDGLVLAGFLALTGQCQNLLLNGNFSATNSGFSSSYPYVATGQDSGPGHYAIRTTSTDFNPAYPAFQDHTTGNGLMMLVDGSDPSNVVWSETLRVKTNSTYVFTGWATGASLPNPAVLLFQVNGATQGTNLALAGSILWTNFSVAWNSGTNLQAKLEIHDVNTNFNVTGDDFALDDLSFSQSGPLQYDALTDFSTNQNPVGVWSHGWSTSVTGPFILQTNVYDSTSLFGWYNKISTPDQTFEGISLTGDTVINLTQMIYADAVLADPQSYAVKIRFTSPSNSVYHVSGFFRLEDTGTRAHDLVIVVNNTTTNFFAYTSGGVLNQLYPFTNTLALQVGDTVDFTVAYGGDYRNLATGVSATLTPLPLVNLTPLGSSGGNLLFKWSTVSNSPYQVQYKTNLLQSSWLNLGPPISAIGDFTTNSITVSNSQSFFRVAY